MKCNKNSQKCTPKSSARPGASPDDPPPGTYANPKSYNDAGKQGDVYVVTQQDLDNNPNCIVGDSLILLQDKDEGALGAYYPDRGSSNSVWKYAWDTIAPGTLSIQLDGVAGRTGIIYGNGLNQGTVVVDAQAQDDGSAQGDPNPGKPATFDLPSAVLDASVKLIDWDTGTPLHGWLVSKDKGDYTNWINTSMGPDASSGEKSSNDNPTSTYFYVSCPEQSTRNIGAIITTSTGKRYAIVSLTDTVLPGVSIIARPQKVYTTDNTTLTAGQDNKVSSHEGSLHQEYTVWQQDYTFRISDSESPSVRIQDWVTSPFLEPQGVSVAPDFWSVFWLAGDPARFGFLYLWPWPSPGSVTVDPAKQVGLPSDYYADITMQPGDDPNTIYFTRLLYEGGQKMDVDALAQTHFTIFDQYGNQGLFAAVRNKDDGGSTMKIEIGSKSSDDY